MFRQEPGTADKSTSEVETRRRLVFISSFALDSIALFCMLDFFTALRIFIKLEKDPFLESRLLVGVDDPLESEDEANSVFSFKYFL